jgi:hypothetical protein
MAVVEKTIPARPEDVFNVLSDGWSYSDWVVGTAHIRAVDAGWPEPGTKIHHKVGIWPVSLHDETEARECRSNDRLVLVPRLWPLGELEVTITVAEVAPGRTRIRLEETFAEGPLRWLRTKIHDLLLHYRNRESIRRLADIAVGRARTRQPR